VQIRNDGKHVILPAAAPIERRPDRVRMPVMMPRESDGKMRRDGSNAATVQPKYPVAERVGVHVAPDLSTSQKQRAVEMRKAYHRRQKEKRRCLRKQRKQSRLGVQDKRPQCAARSGCCFHWLFEPPQQCALFQRNVCAEIKPLSGQKTPHIARLGHDAGR